MPALPRVLSSPPPSTFGRKLGRAGVLVAALGLPACLDGIEGSLRDVDASALADTAPAADTRAPGEDSVAPPRDVGSPPDAGPGANPRPGSPLSSLPVCRPEPVGLEAPTPPALPADAFDRCGLVETLVSATPSTLAASQEVSAITRSEGLIVHETRRVDDLSRVLTRFHGASPARGPQRIERIITSNYPYSGPLREETTWELGPGGAPVEVVQRGADGTTSTWRWTRTDGRLVAQSFERQRGGRLEASRSIAWHWEGERLRFGSQFDSESGVTEQTEWSWDGRGRLVAIERRVDTPLVPWGPSEGGFTPAPPWHRQGFQWTAEGHLTAREVSVYAPSGPVDGNFAWRRAPMDDFEARIPWRGDYATTWPADPRPRFAESLWRARADGACRLPPTTETHGWPEAERAYELGFADGWAEDGLGWRYGYGGYGYGYGQEAWIGPEGLGAEAWPGLGDSGWVWRSFDNRISYDSEGRMISEHFTLTGDVDPVTATPADVGTLIRERTFGPQSAGAEGEDLTLNPLGMLSDLSVFVGAHPDAPTVRRALEWSGPARLGETREGDWVRTFTAEGVTRIEDRVTTTADEDGTIDRWVVTAGGLSHGWAPFHLPWEDPDPRPTAAKTEFTRRRDGEGRVVDAGVRDLDGDGSWFGVTRITWGEDGHPIETLEGPATPGSWQTLTRWEGGALTLRGQGTVQEDGTLALTDGTRYRRDDTGRLVETEQFSAQGTITLTHVYACDD